MLRPLPLALVLAPAATVLATILVAHDVPDLTAGPRALLVLATAPLLGLVLGLLATPVRAELRRLGRWLPLVAGLVPAVGLGLAGAAVGRWDPYLVLLTGGGAAAIVAALRENPGRAPALELLCALALWAPFDLRWLSGETARHVDTLWLGPPGDLAYDWWALAVVTTALLGWTVARDAPVGHRRPRLPDLGVGLGALVAFGALAIPVGLGLHFLRAPTLEHAAPGPAVLLGLGLALTVALPEELLFRGILDRVLRETTGRPAVSLALSSLLFGLSHWNNARHTGEKITYCALASVAGVFYGLAYRRGKGLPAAILAHTLVDLLWKVLLSG